MRLSLTLLATLSLTACNQDTGQVQIDRKGHLFFAQNGTLNSSQEVTYTPPKLHRGETSPYNPDYRFTHGREHTNLGSVDTAPVTSKSLEPLSNTNVQVTRETWHTNATPTLQKSSKYSFIPPVEADVISGYGKKSNGAVNDGINYLIPAGEPVYASGTGTVAYTGDQLKSYGEMVIVKHANGYNTSYAHLGRATVSKGEQVTQGQIIGYVGQTGNVERPQLHFAVRKGSEPVDPNSVLSKQLASY